MANTVLIGKASEYFAAWYLTDNGYDVTLPNGNTRWDMVIERSGKRLFAQVKSTQKKDDLIDVYLKSNENRDYNKDEIDVLIIHERIENKLYFIPVNEIEGIRRLKLYSNNSRSKKNRRASTYEQLPLSEIGNRSNVKEAI